MRLLGGRIEDRATQPDHRDGKGYLLGTDVIYRAPFDHVRWFMLLSNLRHTN